MSLTEAQLERYARHIVLREIGGAGQRRLLEARVLVVGAGGLGSPLMMYLAAAGVGTIGVVDGDVVSLSNLQRQIVHDTDALGEAKVESAARGIRRINPDIRVETHRQRLEAGNALELIGRYDLVADGCDNFPTRLLVNDACYFAKKPLVSAAVGVFEGQLSTYRAFEMDESGRPNPSYRCLVPDAPPPESITTCEQAGIIGALTGVMGSLQAMEVIKEITGAGESLVGRLLIYDALAPRVRIIKAGWDPSNPLTGKNARIRDLSVHLEAAS